MQQRTKLMPYIFVAIICTIFGMMWAYFVAPPIYVGGNPNRLNEASQQQWLLNVAVAASDGYVSFSDSATIELVNRVPHPRETIQAMLNNPNTSPSDVEALQQMLNILPLDLSGTPAPAVPNIFTQVMQMLIPIVIVVALGLILGKIRNLFVGRSSS